MPFPNEHAARQRDPNLFVRIVQLWARDGIRALGGPLKSNPSGPTVVQTLRFDRSRWTVAEAKKWLKDNGHASSDFEPATGGKTMDAPVEQKVQKFFVGVVEKAREADGPRTLTAVVSNEEKDRDGDIVRCDGLDWSKWMQNPVIQWAHDFKGLPIAKGLAVLPNHPAKGMTSLKCEFADHPLARDVYKLYRDGFLNSWSISYMPKERKYLNPPKAEVPAGAVSLARDVHPIELPGGGKPQSQDSAIIRSERWGSDVLKAEVLEVSGVPVPANSGTFTLMEAKSKGLTFETPEAELEAMFKASQAVTVTPEKPAMLLELPLAAGLPFQSEAFTKTISERGEAGKIPCMVSISKENPGISLDIDVIQSKVNEKGQVVVTEARINAVRVNLPMHLSDEAAADTVSTPETEPHEDKGVTPESMPSPVDNARVHMEAVRAHADTSAKTARVLALVAMLKR